MMKRFQKITNLSCSLALILILASTFFSQAAYAVEIPDESFSDLKTQELTVNGIVGVIIRELPSGCDIVSQNPDRFMTPASTMKCLTSAAALIDSKFPLYFETIVITDGPIDKNGVLWGNLIIESDGDPTLESKHFAGHGSIISEIVAAVQTAGIKQIKGGIIIDTSKVPEGGPVEMWTDDDRRWYYGAGHYALNFKDNTLSPDRSMPDPPGAFYDALTLALSNKGIEIEDDDTPLTSSISVIYRHRSAPTIDILRSMMTRSDNMYAEGILRTLAPGHSREIAIERLKKQLSSIGINIGSLKVYDGSGLTRQNSVSPADLASILQFMGISPHSTKYISLFPKAGIEGTVRRFLAETPLAGKLVLKSGSVNGVQCYAGYKIDTDNNPTHVVVIMINDFKGPRGNVVKATENFLLKIFNENE